eukprot:5698675-Prymnesium_polylepis.1
MEAGTVVEDPFGRRGVIQSRRTQQRSGDVYNVLFDGQAGASVSHGRILKRLDAPAPAAAHSAAAVAAKAEEAKAAAAAKAKAAQVSPHARPTRTRTGRSQMST